MRSGLRVLPVFVTALLLIFSWTTAAQDGMTCSALVEQALQALGNNCGDLARNSACYGYNQVESTFSVEVEPGFFSHPSDRADLTTLQSIHTAPLDLALETWGIAVLHLQANLPNTLPGQAVTFIVMGDAQLTNDVDPERAVEPVEPVHTTVARATDVRSGPGLNFNTFGVLTTGEAIAVDAFSRQGDWVRVLYQDRPAWVPLEAVAPAEGLETLPVITSNSRTPMQAFYFTTGFGQPACEEAPNAITVRSPQNLEVDLTVNGVDIRIGSTVTLQNISENQTTFTVQQGHLETVDGTTIEEGETLVTTMDENQNIVAWEEVRPATEEEIRIGTITQTIINQVAPQPPVDPLTDPDEDPQPPSGDPPPTTGRSEFVDGQLVHIVGPGETLFSIATLYNASMPAIAAANNLSDPRLIFVGQRLVIPNPGSGFETISPDDVTGDETASGEVDCAGFAPTSPLSGLAFGSNTFFWNPARGATSYRVNVFNLDSGQSISFATRGPETSVSGSVDSTVLGSGFSFAWEVQALLNGEVVCTSGRVVSQRGSEPPPVTEEIVILPPTPTPEPTVPPQFGPPVQVSPADGSVFSHFPRTTTLMWNPVAGADYYIVEVDCYHCCAVNQWCTDVESTWAIYPDLTNTSFTFDWVGAQPGRWMVCAVSLQTEQTACSGWWLFEYTI